MKIKLCQNQKLGLLGGAMSPQREKSGLDQISGAGVDLDKA